MVIQTRPAAIHLGLPCGTCSRARDKPLPAHLKAQFHDPLPLRDAHNLLGFLILQFCWKYGIRISIVFFWSAPCAFRRVTTWDTRLPRHDRGPVPGGIDPRLAVYARSWDGHYTTTRRDRLHQDFNRESWAQLALGGINSVGKRIQRCTVFAVVWKLGQSDLSHVHARR